MLSGFCRYAAKMDALGRHDVADKVERVCLAMIREAWEQYQLGLDDDLEEETEASTPASFRRTPDHRQYLDQVKSWTPALQRSFDTEFRSEFSDYDAAADSVGADAQPLVRLNDLVKMYDALYGSSPYENERASHEGSAAHLTDEQNVRMMQWQEYLNETVNTLGDKIHDLVSMMASLGSDDTPHLNNPWCPSCGGRLVHPGEREDFETQSALDDAWPVHCRACGTNFLSYSSPEWHTVSCEECGSDETELAENIDPSDLVEHDGEEYDDTKYYCPSCNGEFSEDEIRMMYPVDASALGPYTAQMANAFRFTAAWNHDLPLPQKVQMVQEMLMLIHDGGPLYNRFFGVRDKDNTIQIMRFLDLLSGNDLSKWKDPSYVKQRLKKPWER